MTPEHCPPCPPGRHHPAILHRSRRDGDDSKYRNVCGVCGEQIEREDENGIWVTEKQADEYAAEQLAEIREEMEREWEEALHPEWRCPPRE